MSVDQALLFFDNHRQDAKKSNGRKPSKNGAREFVRRSVVRVLPIPKRHGRSDCIPNLVEYLADTNLNVRNLLSDVYTYSVPGTGAPSSRYQQLLAWLRTDDPDLRVICP